MVDTSYEETKSCFVVLDYGTLNTTRELSVYELKEWYAGGGEEMYLKLGNEASVAVHHQRGQVAAALLHVPLLEELRQHRRLRISILLLV